MKTHDSEQTHIQQYRDLSQLIGDIKTTHEQLETERKYLHTLLSSLPDLIWFKNAEGVYLMCNPLCEQLFGVPEQHIIGKTDYDFFTAKQADTFREQAQFSLESGQPHASQTQLTFKSSGYKGLFHILMTPMFDNSRHATSITVVARDITQMSLNETIQTNANKILEKIARNDLLSDTLSQIVQSIEAQNPDMYCSIMLLDEKRQRLYHACPSRLPDAYCQAVDGIAIGPSAGSCGTAAYRGQAVYVDDIATNPLWADYASLALEHGLQACWSTPILSVQGDVIGTFAVYYLQAYHTATSRDIRTIGYFTHLTSIAIERAQTEDALKASEAKFRRLIEHAPLPLAYSYTNGSISFINQRFTQLFGYTLDDIKTVEQWWERAYPDTQYRREVLAQWNIELTKALQNNNEIAPREYTITKKNGDPCTTEIFGIILEDGFLATFLDLTRHKQIEQAIKENELRLRSILQNANAGILVTDKLGNIIEHNDCFAALLGLASGQITGTGFSHFTHPDDNAIERIYLEQIHANQRQSFRLEKRYINSSDEPIWVDISVNAIRDEQHQLSHLVAVIVDINDRKLAETTLNQQFVELQRWHQAMLGRESRVLELKSEVNTLLEQLGKPHRYCATTLPIKA